MEPQRCADMYITEEWFRMDLLRSYVMTTEMLADDQVTTIPASTTECGTVIPERVINSTQSCKEYDTSFGPTGAEGQVTEFSW